MIYLDTSVVLAHLLAEDRCPPDELWAEDLVSSRLMQYELWTQIHARRLTRSHDEHVHALMCEVSFLELTPIVLRRALEPFPMRVRTLDALHLASLDYLREQGQEVRLASYDDRLVEAAMTLGITAYEFA